MRFGGIRGSVVDYVIRAVFVRQNLDWLNTTAHDSANFSVKRENKEDKTSFSPTIDIIYLFYSN